MKKKTLSILLVVCLLAGILSVALAAGAPKITKQPVSATTDKNGTVSFTIKVKGAKGITWKFINPENGEEITASNISKLFKDIRVSGQNGSKLVLKKVPAEMHNWSLYCHLTGNGYQVDSDIVQLKVYGIDDAAPTAEPEPTAVPEPTAAPEPETTPEPASEPVQEPAQETEPATAAETPQESAETAEESKPRKITVTAEHVSMYPLDSKGNPVEKKKSSKISFKDGTGSVYIHAEYPVKYWVINGVRIEPIGEVEGFVLKNITEDTHISAKLIKKTEAVVVDETVQCQVSCTGCTFTYIAGGIKSQPTGTVPSGAQITVMADSREAAEKGFSINGGAAEQIGNLTFRLTITGDTTITVP